MRTVRTPISRMVRRHPLARVVAKTEAERCSCLAMTATTIARPWAKGAFMWASAGLHAELAPVGREAEPVAVLASEGD